MNDYERVDAELARGTDPDLLCATCPWDRLCVTPPAMSRQEIDRRVARAEEADKARDPLGAHLPTQMLMTAAIYAGRDRTGELCPVFALRLRGPDGRGLADGIRGLMRGGAEPAGGVKEGSTP